MCKKNKLIGGGGCLRPGECPKSKYPKIQRIRFYENNNTCKYQAVRTKEPPSYIMSRARGYFFDLS